MLNNISLFVGLQIYAMICLLGDHRAVPVLQQLAEHSQEETSEDVKLSEVAAEAIERIQARDE